MAQGSAAPTVGGGFPMPVATPARDLDRRDGGSSAQCARLGSEGTALRGRCTFKPVDVSSQTSGDPLKGSAAREAFRP
eukprot:6440163-Alexandrium_andersonii.AAC.1